MPAPRRKVSYKDIARELGVTAMTVSLAMRNHPSIPESTRERVKATAQRLGYRPDPKLVQLMQYMNRRKELQDYPVLCFLNIWPKRAGWRESRYIQRLYAAAEARANAVGSDLQEFWLREKGMSAARMVQILKARGVQGILLPPLPPYEERIDFPLEDFCVVTTSFTAENLGYHLVTTNRHQIITLALREAEAKGYRRMGLVIDEELDRRSNHEVLAHFMFYQSQIPARQRVPILFGKKLSDTLVLKWFQKNRPDVVVSMNNSVYDWMRADGVEVPKEAGFLALSNSALYKERFSGVDERSDLVGVAAVDILTAHLIRNESGRPEHRKLTLIDGTWLEGKTLRDLS